MLEHADRHDAVKASRLAVGQVAIIDQFKGHAVCDPFRDRTFPGERELLFGQGNAQHLYVDKLGERDRHAAPAASDVEDALPRRKRELGGDMRLFRLLGRLQRHVLAGPIGAAILHVAVEKEPIEIVPDIVMMRDVRARTAAAIDRVYSRLDPVGGLADRAALLQLAAPVPGRIRAKKLDQLHDIALVDPHFAVHERLSRAEPRIEDDPAHALPTREPYRHVGKTGRGSAENFACPARGYDRQLALTDDA